MLDGRPRKAAKALLGCLKDSCWVYPAGRTEAAPEERELSGRGGWCVHIRQERDVERGKEGKNRKGFGEEDHSTIFITLYQGYMLPDMVHH